MMKLLFLLPSAFFCALNSMNGQGHDNTMMFGYASNTGPGNPLDFCINILTFDNGEMTITDNQEINMFFNDTDAAISDVNGNLLFYYNGIYINDASHKVMQNGNDINDYNETGYDLPQGGLIIPFPGKSDKYILFHTEEKRYDFPGWGTVGGGNGCFYSIIDMHLNNGLGGVIQKKIPFIVDTVEYGKLAVTRHANGRDWWLAVPKLQSNNFYTILIDPAGIHNMGVSAVGINRVSGIGQAGFSPDGSKYVIQNAIGQWIGDFVDIYDFDRCAGQFSNHRQLHFTGSSAANGAVISPNSRWLYVSGKDKLFQYDLWADSIDLSVTLIDTYEPFNDPFPTYFHRGFLAPDNKVYIITSSGSRTLHTIHKPDEPGMECVFEQRAVRLPCFNARSLPAFANYRLGPADGSSCDTLGLDNIPVAWWRYARDTANPLLVNFTDLSYYEPHSWHWTFGAGSAESTERHPVFHFDS
ncbi:MAG: hypothetical protein L6Q97_27110, partial [Thermoanaerobaculia bacterium]|nr:hypothetical protein [Thermoanaerobaculia bacterium]